MPQFKELPLDPNQLMLFGISVEDAVPADCDVRSFSLVMNCLDYSQLEQKRSEVGCPAYPPKVLAMALSYAYSKGIRSSRQIERMFKYDVRFMWLGGGLKPDHNTISRFRKENWQELKALFVDSVRVCSEVGVVFLNTIAVDGTKIPAAASHRSMYGRDRIERQLAYVEAMLREAEEVDRAEDEEEASSGGSNKPNKSEDLKQLKVKLEAAAQRLRESGKTVLSESDPDSRVMLTRSGKRPGYNMQASVDTESQVIVGMSLTQHEVDNGELAPMVEQVESNTGCSPGVTLADCGYCDETTVGWVTETGHEVLMPLREQYRVKGRNDLFSSKCFLPHPQRDVLICPAGRELAFRNQWSDRSTYRQYIASGCNNCSFYRQCVKTKYGNRRVNVNIMAEQRKLLIDKLESPEGKKLFGLRSQSIEAVFGQLKSNRGLTRFLAWGLDGASSEAAIACIAHNVMKCVALAQKTYLFWLARLQICWMDYMCSSQNAVLNTL
jgi:transposase